MLYLKGVIKLFNTEAGLAFNDGDLTQLSGRANARDNTISRSIRT
jgi:hypothetical protein